MNKSTRLLNHLSQSLEEGRIGVSDMPTGMVKEFLLSILRVNKSAFSPEDFSWLQEMYEKIICCISDNETDKDKILLFFRSAAMCIGLLDKTTQPLLTRAHWEGRYGKDHSPEIEEIIRYMEENREISIFNYDFAKKYTDMEVNVLNDDECGMRYIMHNGRRMYFPLSWSEDVIVSHYRRIMREQDTASPHCYSMEGYGVEEGDIVIDAGVAEGNFTLDNLERAEKIYLIEPADEWLAALKQTFKNESKVIIIPAFLDAESKDGAVCLDDLFFGKTVNYIKMDIEGYERGALRGAEKLFNSSDNLRCAICSYHRKGDEEWITSWLSAHGLAAAVSKGYMFPALDVGSLLEADLRRALVFGRKAP